MLQALGKLAGIDLSYAFVPHVGQTHILKRYNMNKNSIINTER